jgi:hypothetical protein
VWQLPQAGFAGWVPPGGEPWQLVQVVAAPAQVMLAAAPFLKLPWQ